MRSGWSLLLVIMIGAFFFGCSDDDNDHNEGQDTGVPFDGILSKDGDGAVSTAKWITISDGTFQSGQPKTEKCHSNTASQRTVTLINTFEIQSTEVTHGQFQPLMGYHTGKFGPPTCLDCPVNNVNWHEAAAYCNKLSAKAGLTACYTCTGSKSKVTCQAAFSGKTSYTCNGYRLPMNAEFEYAYRAGTTTAFYNGDITVCGEGSDPNAEKIAWYLSAKKTSTQAGAQPVGKKTPNAWGLYDMAGNVQEWCHDWRPKTKPTAPESDPVGPDTGVSRMLRGGNWLSYAQNIVASVGGGTDPLQKDSKTGFRCVRTIP